MPLCLLVFIYMCPPCAYRRASRWSIHNKESKKQYRSIRAGVYKMPCVYSIGGGGVLGEGCTKWRNQYVRLCIQTNGTCIETNGGMDTCLTTARRVSLGNGPLQANWQRSNSSGSMLNQAENKGPQFARHVWGHLETLSTFLMGSIREPWNV